MDNVSVHLIQIGNICIQWSYIEYLLFNSISHQLKLPKTTGVIVTGGLDISSKIRMALNLANHFKLDSDFIKLLEDTTKKIEKLSPERNKIVHGVYSSHPKGILKNIMVEIHRGKKRDREIISLEDIIKISNQITELAKKLTLELEKRNINTA